MTDVPSSAMTDGVFGAMTDGLVQGSHVDLPEVDFFWDRGIVVIGSNSCRRQHLLLSICCIMGG